jgi:predicted nucleic acid-binding protein
MLIVADTSALLALAVSESLSLLDELFGDVRVPAAVFEECTISGKPHADQLRDYLGGKVEAVDLGEYVIAAAGLGAGELEAMALYKDLHADRLLLDDARARRVAAFNQITVVGSLGVLLLAKDQGLIPEVKPKLNSIRAAGFYFSEPLLQEALRLANEL